MCAAIAAPIPEKTPAAKAAAGKSAPKASGPDPARPTQKSHSDSSYLPLNPVFIPVHPSAGAPPALSRWSSSWPLLPLQRKLAIGSTTDALEAEADRVADQVMKTSSASPQIAASGAAPAVRRTCSCGSSGGECPECQKKKEEKLQLKALSSVAPTEAPPIVHQVLRSPGQPMDRETRTKMEAGFGHDLNHVRIHADNQAASSAAAVGASAYTVGNHLVFGANRYQPSSDHGRRLIAHELTHVMQQGGEPALVQRQPAPGAGANAIPASSDPDDPRVYDLKDPHNLHRYIDNLFESVNLWNWNGAFTFYWKEGGAQKKITIPQSDLNLSNPKSTMADQTVYNSKAEALKAVERTAKDYGSLASFYYSYYKTADGVIMPTSFFEESTPLFYAMWPSLSRLQQENFDDIRRGMGILANSINPFPCTEVNEKGELIPSINLGSCALPILLHAAHTHLATHGPGAPGGEGEPRTGGRSGSPGSEPDTQGNTGGAPEHGETKPPAKENQPSDKPPENKPPKDTDEVSEGTGGAVDLDEDIPEAEPAEDPKEKDVDPAICFPAGTLVATCNGLVAIEAVQTGDTVYAFDELSRTVVTQKVRAIVHGSTTEWVKIGTGVEDLRATKSHPFWVESEKCWMAAEELRPGMVLLRQNGETLPIVSVELLPLSESEKTYNLSVEKAENYFVGHAGILVHNIKPKRLAHLNRPGYRNYVLREGGPTGRIYYSGMFGPGVTPAQVQSRHAKNHNRFKPKEGDYFDLQPGTRTYGESRLMEQKLAVDNGTIIGRKGKNYRGNRQDPLAESARKEYNEYKKYRDGCG